MAGHVNHRGWVVLRSILSYDAAYCVDFFERPGCGFGFEHLRADPEDGGRWTAIGGLSDQIFGSALVAAETAAGCIEWLTGERQAGEAWSDWCQQLQAQA